MMGAAEEASCLNYYMGESTILLGQCRRRKKTVLHFCTNIVPRMKSEWSQMEGDHKITNGDNTIDDKMKVALKPIVEGGGEETKEVEFSTKGDEILPEGLEGDYVQEAKHTKRKAKQEARDAAKAKQEARDEAKAKAKQEARDEAKAKAKAKAEAKAEAKANSTGQIGRPVKVSDFDGSGARLNLKVVDSPAWLPHGWITEVRIRTGGCRPGSKDKYYRDPVTGQRLRSRNEVTFFLANGRSWKRPYKDPNMRKKKKLEAKNKPPPVSVGSTSDVSTDLDNTRHASSSHVHSLPPYEVTRIPSSESTGNIAPFGSVAQNPLPYIPKVPSYEESYVPKVPGCEEPYVPKMPGCEEPYVPNMPGCEEPYVPRVPDAEGLHYVPKVTGDEGLPNVPKLAGGEDLPHNQPSEVTKICSSESTGILPCFGSAIPNPAPLVPMVDEGRGLPRNQPNEIIQFFSSESTESLSTFGSVSQNPLPMAPKAEEGHQVLSRKPKLLVISRKPATTKPSMPTMPVEMGTCFTSSSPLNQQLQMQ